MTLEHTSALASFVSRHSYAWEAFLSSQDGSTPRAVSFEYSQQSGGWLLTLAMPCGREYVVNFRDYLGNVVAILSPTLVLVGVPGGKYIAAKVPAL